MAYRKIDTGIWSDKWFKRLSVPAKVLFLYLWTNDRCNAAGLYRVDKEIVKIETGIKQCDLNELLQEVNRGAAYDDIEEIVWIRNFFRWQCQNKKFAIGAINQLKCFPVSFMQQWLEYNSKLLKSLEVDIPYLNGIETVCIPHPPEQNRTETEQVLKERKTNPPGDLLKKIENKLEAVYRKKLFQPPKAVFQWFHQTAKHYGQNLSPECVIDTLTDLEKSKDIKNARALANHILSIKQQNLHERKHEEQTKLKQEDMDKLLGALKL